MMTKLTNFFIRFVLHIENLCLLMEQSIAGIVKFGLFRLGRHILVITTATTTAAWSSFGRFGGTTTK